jgi:hypothetical protein
LITDAIERPNGDREIRGLDIFEISATATPMNRGTRVLDWKSTEQPEPEPEVPTPEELRARSDALERELGLEDPEITLARTTAYNWVTGAMGRTNGDNTEKALTPAQLRAKSERLAREHAPIQIATFDA